MMLLSLGLLGCMGPWSQDATAELPVSLTPEGAAELFFSLQLEATTAAPDTGSGGSGTNEDIAFGATLQLTGITGPVRVLFYSETSDLVPAVTDLDGPGSWSTQTHVCEVPAGTTTSCWQDYRVRIEPRGLTGPQSGTLHILGHAAGDDDSWDSLDGAAFWVELP